MTKWPPRANPHLFGHDEAERDWLRQLDGGKLAHGWILAGAKGIGKATLAFRLARHLLATGDETIARRIATGAHPDLLVIEPEWNEKKGEQGRVITAEQARGVSQFLSLKPAESAWRVVIIDATDAMNTAAANAILKILEEPPPQTALFLISHNPGMLLPTIRSRCAMLKLMPLKTDDFNEVMRVVADPDMDYRRRAALYVLSAGSPGLAAQMEEQGAIETYGQILDILATLPSPDTAKIHAFAESLGGAQGHAPFEMFMRLALVLLERLSKTAASIAVTLILPQEQEILPKLAAFHGPGIWALKWQQAQEQFSLVQARHLDTKQNVIVFFHSIASNDGFMLGFAA